MSNEKPFKHVDMAVLHLDSAAANLWVPKKAVDPEVISLRASWPKRSVRYAQQHAGTAIAREVALFPYTHMESRKFVFNKLSIIAFNSAWVSSAQSAEDVMRRVVDLPVYAEDDDSPNQIPVSRESYAGSLKKLDRELTKTTDLGHSIFRQYIAEKMHTQKYEKTLKDFGRTAASAAVRMATMSMLPAPEERTAFDIQKDLRTLSLGLIEDARYAYENNKEGSVLLFSTLADATFDEKTRDLFITNAPEQAAQAFGSAFAPIKDI